MQLCHDSMQRHWLGLVVEQPPAFPPKEQSRSQEQTYQFAEARVPTDFHITAERD
jgi:hypothetical protein